MTATVSPASPTPFTVEISAQAIVETQAENNRIKLSPNTTLSFAANATSSTGTVTITAVDNDGHTQQHQGGVTVEVSGTVSGGTGVTVKAPDDLEIVEDDGIGTEADSTGPELVRDSDGHGGTIDEYRMVLTFSEPLKDNTQEEHSFRYPNRSSRQWLFRSSLPDPPAPDPLSLAARPSSVLRSSSASAPREDEPPTVSSWASGRRATARRYDYCENRAP